MLALSGLLQHAQHMQHAQSASFCSNLAPLVGMQSYQLDTVRVYAFIVPYLPLAFLPLKMTVFMARWVVKMKNCLKERNGEMKPQK